MNVAIGEQCSFTIFDAFKFKKSFGKLQRHQGAKNQLYCNKTASRNKHKSKELSRLISPSPGSRVAAKNAPPDKKSFAQHHQNSHPTHR
jgi:hypothetical protein